MAHGGTPTSPWVFYDSGADSTGKHIWFSVSFGVDNVLTGGIGHRDAGCQWTKLLIGLGPDGTPDSSTRTINLAGFTGDHAFTAPQLNSVGLTTVADVLAMGNLTVM
jgi:hypothetical protein